MTDFQQQALELAAQQQSPDWLRELRSEGIGHWEGAAWPGRRTELWKYTPLQALQRSGISQWADPAALERAPNSQAQAPGRKPEQDEARALPGADLIDIDATRVVFINGQFSAEYSSELSADLLRFSEADQEQRALISRYLGKVMDSERHLFASLSNAWTSDGLLLHVPRGQRREKPVYVVHLSSAEAQPAAANQRLLVVAEESSSVEVIEHFVSTQEKQNGFVNSLSEIRVEANARVQHYRINLEEENLIHVGGVHVDLLRDAVFSGFTIAQGSRLKRIDYQVNHLGEGAHLELNGVYLPRNEQLIDYHTNVEHRVPRCTSSEVFRGIVSDSARAVFNGRIHIHPEAQKTLAELSNKNLLTSSKAEVDTKPELEIYADDVKCAHGATVSQLDATALYYLQTRGIPHKEAQVMLSFGFINELLKELPQPALRDFLQPQLSALFGKRL